MPRSLRSAFAIFLLALSCVAVGTGGSWWVLSRQASTPAVREPCTDREGAQALLEDLHDAFGSLDKNAAQLSYQRDLLVDGRAADLPLILRSRDGVVSDRRDLERCQRQVESLLQTEKDPLARQLLERSLDSVAKALLESEEALKVDTLPQTAAPSSASSILDGLENARSRLQTNSSHLSSARKGFLEGQLYQAKFLLEWRRHVVEAQLDLQDSQRRAEAFLKSDEDPLASRLIREALEQTAKPLRESAEELEALGALIPKAADSGS